MNIHALWIVRFLHGVHGVNALKNVEEGLGRERELLLPHLKMEVLPALLWER